MPLDWHAPLESKAPSRMSKPMKTAAELLALLNAELRKQDACTGVSVEAVTPIADEKVAYTWTATAIRRSGGPVPGQCSRFFVARSACFNSGMIYCPRRIYRH
jgi:hypothetical protein